MGKTIDRERLCSSLESCYAELAYTNLAMIYFSFCEKDETPDEFGRDKVSLAKKYRDELEALMKKCFEEGSDAVREEAFALRKSIKELVNKLVDKRERIALDEYVAEREGNADEPLSFADDDEAARKILQAIFAYEDNPTINENIKTTVYELPVRMTKVRFFDILEDGLKKYIGGPVDAITRAVYMIESAAGIRGELVSDISEDNSAVLDAEVEYLNDIAELCNYVCVLSECSADMLEKHKAKSELLKNVLALSGKGMEDEADRLFMGIEGQLEQLAENQVVFEGRFDSLIEENRGNLSETEKKLERMKRLMSASVYADLEDSDESEITAQLAREEFEKLSAKLNECFSKGERPLNRARMAAVLSSLPVFFNSRTDCMNYVREALAACRDNHEKNVAVANILSSIAVL